MTSLRYEITFKDQSMCYNSKW